MDHDGILLGVITRNISRLFVAVGCAGLMFVSSAGAMDIFEMTSAEGVYLIQTRTDMKFSAKVEVVGSVDVVNNRVVLLLPNGEKIVVPLRKEQPGNGRHVYKLPPVSVKDLFGDRSVLGTYTFILENADGDPVATYEEFFVPYSAIMKEELPYFDDSGISPKDQAVVRGDKVVLSWDPIKGAGRYLVDIYIDQEASQRKYLTTIKIKDNKVELDTRRFKRGKYYWQIEALHEEDDTLNDKVVYYLENGKVPCFYLERDRRSGQKSMRMRSNWKVLGTN